METFRKYFRFYFACLGMMYAINFIMFKIYGDPIPEFLLLHAFILFIALSIADYFTQKRKAKQQVSN